MHTMRRWLAVPRAAGAFRGSFKAGSGGAIRQLFGLLVTWQERAQQRYALARLDDWMLRDIGLSRADIHAEIRKPFWRA